ncbi:MAG: transposase [Methylocystis sp.]
MIVDSTGLKLRGAGEWLFEKHGTAKRRSWRKLHIGIDADNGEIVAFDLTDKEVDDALHVAPLLDQLAGAPASFMATALMTGLAFSKAFWREIRTLNSSCLHAREP